MYLKLFAATIEVMSETAARAMQLSNCEAATSHPTSPMNHVLEILPTNSVIVGAVLAFVLIVIAILRKERVRYS